MIRTHSHQPNETFRDAGPPAGSALRRRDRTMLALAGAVVFLSMALRVRPDERVEFRAFPGWPAPHTCLSRVAFGVACPACGLTRSLVHLAAGDWSASLAVHRLGWLFAVAVLLQFPYRIQALRQPDGRAADRRLPRLFGYSLILLLIGNWILELAR